MRWYHEQLSGNKFNKLDKMAITKDAAGAALWQYFQKPKWSGKISQKAQITKTNTRGIEKYE